MTTFVEDKRHAKKTSRLRFPEQRAFLIESITQLLNQRRQRLHPRIRIGCCPPTRDNPVVQNEQQFGLVV
jgi:hypothetical protein